MVFLFDSYRVRSGGNRKGEFPVFAGLHRCATSIGHERPVNRESRVLHRNGAVLVEYISADRNAGIVLEVDRVDHRLAGTECRVDTRRGELMSRVAGCDHIYA